MAGRCHPSGHLQMTEGGSEEPARRAGRALAALRATCCGHSGGGVEACVPHILRFSPGRQRSPWTCVPADAGSPQEGPQMRGVTRGGDSHAQPTASGGAPPGPAPGPEIPRTPRTSLVQPPDPARAWAALSSSAPAAVGGGRGGGWPPVLEGRSGARPGWAGGRELGETTCSSGWAQGARGMGGQSSSTQEPGGGGGS